MTKLIVALDTTDLPTATSLAKATSPSAALVKLGLEFFYAHGASGYRAIAEQGTPIFLDLKLHDIPNTVAGGLKALLPLKPAMLTLHTLGGPEMLGAAKRIIESSNHPIIALGVTLLTSMDQAQADAIGLLPKLEDRVRQLAGVALKAGLEGIVCSAHELPVLRKEFGNALQYVVPGIRPEGAAKGDQSRTMTPAEAKQNGADYIVVGRPITQAANPAEAVAGIAASLQATSH